MGSPSSGTAEFERGSFNHMKVILGPLSIAGLEENVGPDLPAAIDAALVHYVGKLDSGKRLPRFPEFTPVQGIRGVGGESRADTAAGRVEVEVEVEEGVMASLAAEADRQGVGLTDLAAHAVLVYLAEVDLIGDPDAGVPARGQAFVVRAGDSGDSPLH
jgi:hypothetical protein